MQPPRRSQEDLYFGLSTLGRGVCTSHSNPTQGPGTTRKKKPDPVMPPTSILEAWERALDQGLIRVPFYQAISNIPSIQRNGAWNEGHCIWPRPSCQRVGVRMCWLPVLLVTLRATLYQNYYCVLRKKWWRESFLEGWKHIRPAVGIEFPEEPELESRCRNRQPVTKRHFMKRR